MKNYIILYVLILLLGFVCVFLLFRVDNATAAYAPDVVAGNDIIMTAMQNDERTAALDIITDYLYDSFAEMDASRQLRDTRLQIALYALLGLFAVAGAFMLLYIHRRIIAPFNKMNQFARRIAAGDLEIPLEMDRGGSFGAFTESFDLMRTELARSREAEKQANQSKKELVASLSHDIKTPVASIKAVAELMSVMAKDDKERLNLETISAKADQIDLLISNMFIATLEELQELSVTTTEVPSTTISELIQTADYQRKAPPADIPECLVIADPARLAQVLDNIFANAYKYAGTDMEVEAYLEDDSLRLSISDHGRGVTPEELLLVTQKYFRGQNAKGQSGTGLGLYVSKYFMEKMSGQLSCENGYDGFTVILTLALA